MKLDIRLWVFGSKLLPPAVLIAYSVPFAAPHRLREEKIYAIFVACVCARARYLGPRVYWRVAKIVRDGFRKKKHTNQPPDQLRERMTHNVGHTDGRFPALI